jgi:uncharacterized protein (TIGR02145 family)
MILIKTLLAGFLGATLIMADISGIVTDTNAIPIAGATVQLEKGGQTATTNADGSFTLSGITGIISSQNNLLSPHKFSATIQNGVLCLNITKKIAVMVTTFDLTGKALSVIKVNLDAGTHSLVLPQRSNGIYLYDIKSGNSEVVLRDNFLSEMSHKTTMANQRFESTGLAKQAKVADAINDVIAITKTGYLNYQGIVMNSDSSGMTIKLVASAGTVTDTDGNVYQTVKIGTQIWMAENLKTTRYNNGLSIPLISDSVAWSNLKASGFCWYNNDSVNNKNTFGALYDWYTVQTGNLAPNGWHVPTDSEWTVLTNYLGGISIAGGVLKEAGLLHWSSPNTGAKNTTGFSALPGGYRGATGPFTDIGNYGVWWSSTAYNSLYAWYRNMGYDGANVTPTYYDYYNDGFSVRCVKNN